MKPGRRMHQRATQAVRSLRAARPAERAFARLWLLVRASVAGWLLSLSACSPVGSTSACPDLTGTYEIRPDSSDGTASVLFQSWLAGRADLPTPAWTWRRLDIRGNASESLHLRLLRPRVEEDSDAERQRNAQSAALADRRRKLEWAVEHPGEPGPPPLDEAQGKPPQNPPNPWADVVWAEFSLRKGSDYYCKGGKLVGDWLKNRQALSPATAKEFGLPGWTPAEVRVHRGAAGHLLAELKLSKRYEFTVWCGDGCKGIPVWLSSQQHLERWSAAPPLPPGGRFLPASAVVPLQPSKVAQAAGTVSVDNLVQGPGGSAGLKDRQANVGTDVRTDVHADVQAGPNPADPPWPPVPDRLAQVLLAHLPAKVLPGPVVPEAGGWKVTLFSEQRPDLPGLLSALEVAPELVALQIREVVQRESGMWTTQVWFKWRTD